jgi:hypothetical protein
MFRLRAGVHPRDSKHTPSRKHGGGDPAAASAIISLAELTIELIEGAVIASRRSDPSKAQDVRLRHMHRLEVGTSADLPSAPSG